jgi:hypothetical protein
MIVTKYIYLAEFITKELAMLVESLTIGIIIGICGLVAWLVKNKFQPEIERDIQEREQKTLKYAREIRKNPLK